MQLRTTVLSALVFAPLLGCSGSTTAAPAQPVPDAVFTKERIRTTLPDLKDEALASEDRRTMQSLIERAEKEKKTLVLDVSAAWCGPCQMFAKDFADHPESAKELTDMNVIFAKSEYEKYPTGQASELNDYLPMPAKFFPSFYAYIPGKGWKLLGPENSVKALKDDIVKLVPARFLTVDELKVEAEADAKKQQNQSQEKVANSEEASMSIYNAAAVYTYGETRDLIRHYQNLKRTYPKSYVDYYASNLMGQLLDYVGAGAVTIEGVNQDFPEMGARLRDLSNKGFTIKPFAYQLARKFQTDGLKAAASECDAKWTEYKKQLVPGSLAGAAYQKKIVETDSKAGELCASLDLRANGVSEALKTRVANLPKEGLTDWLLLAGLDQIEPAVALFDKRYKEFEGYYVKYEKTYTEELEKAKEKKDEKAEKEANEGLALLKFQRAYHEGVAVTVENNLRTKLPIHTITVMN